MNEYLIGAGAVLTAGSDASISSAVLHLQTDPAIVPGVEAALVDFESARAGALSRVVILAAGWNGTRVRTELIEPLLARGECSLAEVLMLLARARRTGEVHLFARWLPGELLTNALESAGVKLVIHPLEEIRAAALVSGQRFSRWPAPLQAA